MDRANKLRAATLHAGFLGGAAKYGGFYPSNRYPEPCAALCLSHLDRKLPLRDVWRTAFIMPSFISLVATGLVEKLWR